MLKKLILSTLCALIPFGAIAIPGPQPGGSSSALSTLGYTLIGSDVPETAQDTLSVTGLGGALYARYRVEIRVKWGATGTLFITFNDDTAQDGYTRFTTTGTSSGNNSQLYDSVTSGNGKGFLLDVVQATTDYAYAYVVGSTNDAYLTKTIIRQISSDLGTITLRSGTSGVFDTGSYLKVYKYD